MRNDCLQEIVIACQSSGFLIRDIAKAFASSNEKVSVLASSDELFQKGCNSFENRLNVDKICRYDRSSSVKRIFTWLLATFQMAWKILTRYRKAQLLLVSNPPLAPLLPLIVKNRYLLLVFDVYPDVLFRQNVISEHHIIAKAWSWANRKVYSRAGGIFTISDGMKVCLSQYVEKEKIKVVNLWAEDTMKYVCKAENLFIKEHHLENQFVVMYSGNLGNTHPVEILVELAKIMADDDIQFVIIGEGEKKRKMIQKVESESLNNVLLLPYQPIDFLPHSLSAADIAVVTLDARSSDMSVPSKTFNLLSLGIPLMCIANPDSELGRIVIKYDVGRQFAQHNLEGMRDYILYLKNNPDVKAQFQRRAKEASLYYTSSNANEFVREEVICSRTSIHVDGGYISKRPKVF